MLWAAALVFLVPLSPWSAAELRTLAEADDAFAAPHLERALESSLAELRDFPVNLAPPDLEDELVEALLGLERLDPRRALPWCRRILELESSTRSAWAARAVLARSGDPGVVRTALREYFRSPEAFRRVLGEAALATDDVRLREFSSFGGERRLPSEHLFRSRLKLALAGPRPRDEVQGPPLVGSSDDVLSLQAHVLSLLPAERLRAIRRLVERDHVALVGLPMDAATVDRLSPYLARSQYRALRDRARRARSRRGLALASLLLSPMPAELERREHVEAMRDAWGLALQVSGRDVYGRLSSAVGEDELVRWIREASPTEALVRIPLAAARERLIQWGAPRAVTMLGERLDVALSIRALEAFRRSPDEEVRLAAEKVLLGWGAPGATVFLRSQLSSPTLSALLPNVLAAPILDPELMRQAIERSGALAGSAPDAFAAMIQFHERYPREFLAWLESRNEAFRERANIVMALSGDPRRLPLLIDIAVQGSGASRVAAFRSLAELELGSFERRLHRLAGDPDRRVRFQTATALVPTGQSWTLRLLVAELDDGDRSERREARRAVERLEPDDARELLEAMILDETASPFAIELFLELCSEQKLQSLSARLWQILAPHVAARDHTALRAASGLSHAEANEAVRRYLNIAR